MNSVQVLPLLSLYSASTRKEAILALEGISISDKVATLKSTIELIDTEAEMLIKQGVNDIAIAKMSQVVMLEEVEMALERVMLKQGNL